MGQNNNVKNIDQADKKLVDLMFFGLDHGIEGIKINGKGPLIPFIILVVNGEKQMKRFVADKLEDGLNEGIKYLKEEKESESAIVVYDGYLTIEGKKLDAVITKGFDRKDEIGYLIGQRYSTRKFLRGFKLIGNPTFVGNEDQILK